MMENPRRISPRHGAAAREPQPGTHRRPSPRTSPRTWSTSSRPATSSTTPARSRSPRWPCPPGRERQCVTWGKRSRGARERDPACGRALTPCRPSLTCPDASTRTPPASGCSSSRTRRTSAISSLTTWHGRATGLDRRGRGPGLEKIQQDAPDLVLLDLMLPGLDGLESAGACATARPADLPIVMLTAKGEEADRIVGLRAGRRRLRHQALQRARAGAAHARRPAPLRGARRAPDLRGADRRRLSGRGPAAPSGGSGRRADHADGHRVRPARAPVARARAGPDPRAAPARGVGDTITPATTARSTPTWHACARSCARAASGSRPPGASGTASANKPRGAPAQLL